MYRLQSEGKAVAALLMAVLAIFGPEAATARPHRSGDTTEIRNVLARGASDWSAGKLDQFMRLYEAGPHTTYVGSDGIVSGRDRIRTLYLSGFGSSAATMGQLRIEPEIIQLMGRDYALATGHYEIERPAGSGKMRRGVFTLTFHRSPKGWAVISDHSS